MRRVLVNCLVTVTFFAWLQLAGGQGLKETATLKLVGTLDKNTKLTHVSSAFSPDSKLLVAIASTATTAAKGGVAKTEYQISLWDVAARKTIATHNGEGTADRLEVIGNDTSVTAFVRVSKGKPETASIASWDFATGKQKTIFDFAPADHVQNMSLSPDGKSLALQVHKTANSNARQVKVVNLASDKELLAFQTTSQGRILVFSPDGKLLVVAHQEGKINGINIWDIDSRKAIATRHTGYPYALAFSSDGRDLVVSTGSELQFWNVAKLLKGADAPDERVQVKEPEKQIRGNLRFGSDGKLFIGERSLWDASKRSVVAPLSGGNATFSPDGKLCATSVGLGSIMIVDVSGVKPR